MARSANKRKKSSRHRGSHTHGWGAKKKHRGAGHRGGRGKSGTGKKAHQRMPSVWKDHPFGRHGFVPPTATSMCAVNIDTLNEHILQWLEQKIVAREGNAYVVNLKQLHYDKLLGRGKALYTYKIIVSAASRRAIEKIKHHGGDVILQ